MLDTLVVGATLIKLANAFEEIELTRTTCFIGAGGGVDSLPPHRQAKFIKNVPRWLERLRGKDQGLVTGLLLDNMRSAEALGRLARVAAQIKLLEVLVNEGLAVGAEVPPHTSSTNNRLTQTSRQSFSSDRPPLPVPKLDSSSGRVEPTLEDAPRGTVEEVSRPNAVDLTHIASELRDGEATPVEFKVGSSEGAQVAMHRCRVPTDELRATFDPDVLYCTACSTRVYRVKDEDGFRYAALAGHCVRVHAEDRRGDDLEELSGFPIV